MATAAADIAPASKPPVKIRQTKMLIDGEWMDSASGKTFETINAATGEVIAHVAEGDASVAALADLPLGWQARRENGTAPWVRSPHQYDD